MNICVSMADWIKQIHDSSFLGLKKNAEYKMFCIISVQLENIQR